jgi:hypothetical protein
MGHGTSEFLIITTSRGSNLPRVSREYATPLERNRSEATTAHTCRLLRRYTQSTPLESKKPSPHRSHFSPGNLGARPHHTAATARRRRAAPVHLLLSPMAAAARGASAARSPLLIHNHRRLPQVRPTPPHLPLPPSRISPISHERE